MKKTDFFPEILRNLAEFCHQKVNVAKKSSVLLLIFLFLF